MIGDCSRCLMHTVLAGPEALCFRCRPPTAEELAATWLPEPYTLTLTAMDVGFLQGMVYRRLRDESPGSVVPAGVARLLGKLDALAEQIYEDSRRATA